MPLSSRNPNPPGAAPGAPTPAGWDLDGNGFRLTDGSGVFYGAPSGKTGVTVELASSGVGFMAKLLLQSAMQGARFVLYSTAALQQIFDPSGVVRVEMGNLAANGVSPAQWGMRANTAAGVAIWDSLGVIQHPTSLGHGAPFNNGYTVTSTTDVAQPSCSFTIILTPTSPGPVAMNHLRRPPVRSGP